MAKKAVATFKKGDGRTYSKVIKLLKIISLNNGA